MKIFTAFAFLMLSLCLGLSKSVQADNFTFAVGEWPPHISETLPNNGPHAELMTKTFEKAGHQVTLQFMKWNRAYELVKTGEVDGSFSWSQTPERQAEVAFSKTPINSTSSRAYYSKKKHPNGLGATSIADLAAKGYRFVGVKGYWYEAAIKDSGAKSSMVGDASSAWKMLNAGRADVYISTDSVADTEINLHLGADALSTIGVESEPTEVQEQFPIFAKTPKGQQALEIFDTYVAQ